MRWRRTGRGWRRCHITGHLRPRLRFLAGLTLRYSPYPHRALRIEAYHEGQRRCRDRRRPRRTPTTTATRLMLLDRQRRRRTAPRMSSSRPTKRWRLEEALRRASWDPRTATTTLTRSEVLGAS